jgi:predicted nucleotide-binding protein
MKITNEQKNKIKLQLSNLLEGKWYRNNNSDQFKSKNGGICNIFDNGTCTFQGKAQPKEEIEKIVDEIILDKNKIVLEEKQIFIVYGHDTTSREQLELVLQKLGLNHSRIVNDTGMTIIEALENKITEIHCGIVLLTDDDLAISKHDYDKNYSNEKSIDNLLLTKRARQNVILELGMLISVLGRKNVIVLKKEGVEVPSDMNGVFYISFKNHIKETVPQVAKRLQDIGFDINTENLLQVIV